MLLDPRNGPEWDLPTPIAPRRTWAVASVPRSGSTLLCRLLWDTGRVGAPKEYLNPMQVRDWEARTAPLGVVRSYHRVLRGDAVGLAGKGLWSRRRFHNYVERVRRHRTGHDGWFGLKVHWHHFDHWFLARGWDPEEILGPTRWIVIRREDRVAQAVSWTRALQTGRWASHQPDRRRPRYDEDAIAERLGVIEAHEAAWDDWLARHGHEPLRLTYEALVADPDAEIRRALQHLEVPDAARLAAPPTVFRRQGDPEREAWAVRFRQARPELAEPSANR